MNEQERIERIEREISDLREKLDRIAYFISKYGHSNPDAVQKNTMTIVERLDSIESRLNSIISNIS